MLSSKIESLGRYLSWGPVTLLPETTAMDLPFVLPRAGSNTCKRRPPRPSLTNVDDEMKQADRAPSERSAGRVHWRLLVLYARQVLWLVAVATAVQSAQGDEAGGTDDSAGDSDGFLGPHCGIAIAKAAAGARPHEGGELCPPCAAHRYLLFASATPLS